MSTSTTRPSTLDARLAVAREHRERLTAALVAGTGLPCDEPPRRGGLVVSIEACGSESGEVNVVGFHAAEKLIASPARTEALARVEQVLRGQGYATTRRSTGAVRWTRGAAREATLSASVGF